MTYSTIVTILSAVITGGFVLVFVEIGNRKNRENDRYRQLMEPFMRKLCAYFRYIEWTSKCIIYPRPMNENEEEFKRLVDKMGRYGGELIIGGGDYSLNHFPAKELESICYGINNIWYYHDRMRPSQLKWDDDFSLDQEMVNKELVRLDKSYLKDKSDLHQLVKVSGDFFTDEYQPIEYEPENHEWLSKLYRKQSMFVSASLLIVLITLCLMICVAIPAWLLKSITIAIICLFGISLMFLFVEERKQVQWLYNMDQRMEKFKKN